ncbi:MAG: hypothetical protein U0165_17215 [Polyangiaceae bacterium]
MSGTRLQVGMNPRKKKPVYLVRPRSFFPLVVVISSFLASCSSDSSPSNDPSNGTTESKEKFVDDLSKILCEAAAPCCAERGLNAVTSACESQLAADYFFSLQPALYNANIVFDGARAAECLEKTKALTGQCGATWLKDGGTDICDRVSRGTSPPGASCGSSLECEKSDQDIAVCEGASGEASHCLVIHVGAVGDACDDLTGLSALPNEAKGCDPANAYCEPSTLRCTTKGTEGQPCVGASQQGCIQGLYCSVDLTTSESLCVRPAQLGESCSAKACVGGTFCDSSTQLCVEELHDLAACDNSTQCRSHSCNGASCTPSVTDPNELISDVPYACQ